jgi:hypothetical protein
VWTAFIRTALKALSLWAWQCNKLKVLCQVESSLVCLISSRISWFWSPYHHSYRSIQEVEHYNKKKFMILTNIGVICLLVMLK